MLLWVMIALLTVGVMAAVLWPLWRVIPATLIATSSDDQAADIAVYRDQLKEIDADLERGLIGKDEAVSARLEVSRRLLHLSESGDGQAVKQSKTDKYAQSGSPVHKMALYGTGLAVPAIAFALYMFNGTPSLPGLPHAERMAATAVASTHKVNTLIANVEADLRANPNNRVGWEVIASVYLEQGRYDDAIAAYGRVIALAGENPRRLMALAMAKLSKSKGAVSPDVRNIFTRVIKLAPDQPEALYWLAVSKEQNGELEQAANDYRAILSAAPANAPWRGVVARQLGEVMMRMSGDQNSAAGRTQVNSASAVGADRGSSSNTTERGPTAADIAASQNMTSGDRAQMINNMVAGLASRLKDNGNDLPGWQKLVRAYVVLGKPDKAKQALRDARKSFARDAKALVALDRMAKQFKLES